jgi:WD40 repeat protein
MGELKQKLATMSPEKRLYTLETLPTHFGEAGQFQRLYRLLTDFDFIEAKLDALDVQALIQDYEFVGNLTSSPFQEKPGEELSTPAKTLTLIEETIRLSALLSADKTQLAGQLWGRLMAFELPEIQALLAQAKKELFTLKGHTISVNTVTVTPDGKCIISGSDDKTLKVWNLETEEEVFTLIGHTDRVAALAVTPDGKRVISASADNTLKISQLLQVRHQGGYIFCG